MSNNIIPFPGVHVRPEEVRPEEVRGTSMPFMCITDEANTIFVEGFFPADAVKVFFEYLLAKDEGEPAQ
jgi:hypothetical protein